MSHNVVMLVPGVVKVRLNAGLQRRRLAYNGHAGGANRRGHCQTCPCRATAAACRFPQALRGAEIADWAARADHLRRGNDGIGIDPIVPVEVGDGTRLAEMLDTEWPDAVAVDRPSHARIAGWPSSTVTMPQSRGRPANNRSMCERACTSPRSRAR